MEKCCCRWSLRFGSIIWGWLSLMIGVLGVIVCAVTLAQWNGHRQDIVTRYPDSPKVPDFTLGVVITFLLFQAGRAFFASLLLVGIYKELPRLMFPFLIFTIFSVLHVFTTLLSTVDLAVTFPEVVVIDLVGSIAMISAEIYCGLAVKAFYRELRRKKRKELEGSKFEEIEDDDDDEEEEVE